MSDTEYKFDVAFSFLARDEAAARELSELLQRQALRTFVYSEQQLEVAGTDGIETFSRVFRHDARLVVVLFRPGWGSSKWTQLEENAIKGRGLNDGFRSVKFVVLEKNPTLPVWLPEGHIWIDKETYGAAGAAAVIAERARTLGSQIREESSEESARRIAHARTLEKDRLGFLRSDAGNAAARESFAAVRVALEQLAPQINSNGIDLMCKDGGQRMVAAVSSSMSATVTLDGLQYGNSAEDAAIEFWIWDGHPSLPGLSITREAKKRARLRFVFDLTADGPRWCVTEAGVKQEYSPEGLTQFVVKRLLDYIERDDAKRKSAIRS